MKFETEVRAKKNQARDAKKAFIVLAGALLATSVYVLIQQLYLLRELLLVVACAAVLVFFAANLAVLGFLFHAAGRSIGHSIRKATPRIAQPEKAHAEQHVGPLLVSPTIGSAPTTGRL
jgi:hypothetical protein